MTAAPQRSARLRAAQRRSGGLRRPGGRWAVAAALGLAAVLPAGRAAGQPTDNSYAVDIFQGPILAPTRVTALAGAYAGYAEGIAGFVANAASPAVRSAYSPSWLDLDLDASMSIPLPIFENDDFDNSGDLDADYSDFIYLSAGGQIQAGAFGTGFFADLQRYALSLGDTETVVTVGRYTGLVAWQLLGDQLVIGAGVRVLTLGISAPDTDLTVIGAAPQYGFLIRPDWTPFRIGATFRHPVQGGTSIGSGASIDGLGVERAGGLIVPELVEQPWELEVGLAIQVGARPLNPAWINPHDHEDELRQSYRRRTAERRRDRQRRLLSLAEPGRRAALQEQLEREEQQIAQQQEAQLERDLERLKDERRARARNWPREHLLLTFALLTTGPVDNAIHLKRFLAQGQPGVESACQAVASGEEINFSPRFGIEMEPVPMYVHTRFGSYYEPNRFRYSPDECSDRVGRMHFTFGADVKLFSTTWFGLVPEVTYKLQAYGDLAPRYRSFGAGFGVWY